MSIRSFSGGTLWSHKNQKTQIHKKASAPTQSVIIYFKRIVEKDNNLTRAIAEGTFTHQSVKHDFSFRLSDSCIFICFFHFPVLCVQLLCLVSPSEDELHKCLRDADFISVSLE